MEFQYSYLNAKNVENERITQRRLTSFVVMKKIRTLSDQKIFIYLPAFGYQSVAFNGHKYNDLKDAKNYENINVQYM